MDCVRDWSEKSEIFAEQLLRWIGLSGRKFRDWRLRYGKANEHNQLVSAVKAEVLGSIPGGLKAIRDHGARELSTENQKFLETIVKIADQPDNVLAYMLKALQEINIGNSTALWQTLLQQRQAWEKAVGADVRKTITDVQLTQQDSLMRLKYGCKL